MLKQKYTTVTQLHEVNNKDIIEYFENAVADFCKIIITPFLCYLLCIYSIILSDKYQSMFLKNQH